MKNTFGNSLSITVFGESHGSAVGVVLDGMTPGVPVREDFIAEQLTLRRPVGGISTPRVERDAFVIESGVFNGRTTGTPICILIPNENTKSSDYSDTRYNPRPGHADYSAFVKYGGFEDYRGGGHFSGRVTAGITAAGAIVLDALRAKGIDIGTHIARCAGVCDRSFANMKADIERLRGLPFAVLDEAVGEEMKSKILQARAEGDSVGGVLETAVLGIPTGVGEPFFDSLESMLSHALFSIPAVKGVEFGDGFALAEQRGSQANDPFAVQNGRIETLKNSNGGINGGISNGMPILFRIAVKPTPTIAKAQKTVNMMRGENAELAAKGRHDPCIVHRARVVADSMAALAVCDLLLTKYGTDWLRK